MKKQVSKDYNSTKSTIEKCSRMEDMKKQVSKGYNSTSHMAGLQSEVELRCNLYKKKIQLFQPNFPHAIFSNVLST